MSTRGPIVDPFGRRINYVRLSVTDRCNFRCLYCMPDEDVDVVDRDTLLSFEETQRLCRVLAQMGVDRIRLTGGEPTVRRGFLDLVRRIAMAKDHGLRDLSMTTNGWNLANIGPALREVGMDRVNISLDTLDPANFRRITQRDRLSDVLEGIDAVVDMDWLPLKINVVVCRGLNDTEVADFVAGFAHLPVTIRFIEYMAFGESRFSLVPWAETKAKLDERFTLEPVQGPGGSGPATYWRVEGTKVEIGTIGALSSQFCASCNRVRITADGELRNCLAFEPHAVSLRDVMRETSSDDDLEWAIRGAILHKPLSHIQLEDGSNAFEGSMVRIGG